MKKTWEAPRLIVLVRGRPGEAVLTFCRDSNALLSQTGDNAGCNLEADNCGVCSANRVS